MQAQMQLQFQNQMQAQMQMMQTMMMAITGRIPAGIAVTPQSLSSSSSSSESIVSTPAILTSNPGSAATLNFDN
jgi:hypothetical protein